VAVLQDACQSRREDGHMTWKGDVHEMLDDITLTGSRSWHGS